MAGIAAFTFLEYLRSAQAFPNGRFLAGLFDAAYRGLIVATGSLRQKPFAEIHCLRGIFDAVNDTKIVGEFVQQLLFRVPPSTPTFESPSKIADTFAKSEESCRRGSIRFVCDRTVPYRFEINLMRAVELAVNDSAAVSASKIGITDRLILLHEGRTNSRAVRAHGNL